MHVFAVTFWERLKKKKKKTLTDVKVLKENYIYDSKTSEMHGQGLFITMSDADSSCSVSFQDFTVAQSIPLCLERVC